MSADRTLGAIVCGLAFCGGPAFAAEDEVPDVEFLEYLGMWELSDEDWLLLEGEVTVDNEKRSDPATEGEEPAENEDES